MLIVPQFLPFWPVSWLESSKSSGELRAHRLHLYDPGSSLNQLWQLQLQHQHLFASLHNQLHDLAQDLMLNFAYGNEPSSMDQRGFALSSQEKAKKILHLYGFPGSDSTVSSSSTKPAA